MSTDHKVLHYVVFFFTPLLLLPSTLFSNTLSLRSSLSVNGRVSHAYKITDKLIVLYILIFIFSDSKLEHTRFCTEWYQVFLYFNLFLISSWIEFWYVRVVNKYLDTSTLPKELLSFFILWLRPAFWSPDMTMYFVLAAFTSSPISLQVTTKASVFFFIVCILPHHQHEPEADWIISFLEVCK